VRTKKSIVFLSVLLLVCTRAVGQGQEIIEAFSSRSVPFEGTSMTRHQPEFKDTISWDTLYQVRAANGFPVSYYRKVQASVCFDNKCRLLNIILHWNITGRYLGFELPAGEYLSKAEHEPFVPSEYERLHMILSDPLSSLQSIAYSELVPVTAPEISNVDAVSSPTAKDLLDLVVEGAAFTTYKLWHIIHGATADQAARLTIEALSPELLVAILDSPHTADQLWALDQRYVLKTSTHEIRKAILELVKDTNYNVAERAIEAVTVYDLQDEEFQKHLVACFDEVNYALKKAVIAKLGESQTLSQAVVARLASKVNELNGDLVGVVLSLFSEKQIRDDATIRLVAGVLKNPNVFVSKQAYDFLQSVDPKDPQVLKKLTAYARAHSLQ